MYIFLDIDGVLNCKADWNKPYTINNKCLDNFVKLCKDLSKKYGVVKIVLTSSWKEGFDIIDNIYNNDNQKQKGIRECSKDEYGRFFLKYNIVEKDIRDVV